MRTLLLVGLTLVGFGCQPPCVPVNSPAALQGACRPPGTVLSADAGFTLRGQPGPGGSCHVTVDGGQIDVMVDSFSCAVVNGGAADAVPPIVSCSIPPLPAGTYTLNSNPPLTFTLPESADAGVPPCS